MPEGIAVVKSLSASEIAQWRRGKDVASSDVPQVAAPAVFEEDEFDLGTPAWQAELDGPDIMAELLGEWWGNMTRDRDSMERALRWLRVRIPNAIGHMTDHDLLEHLNGLAKKAASRHAEGQRRPSRDLKTGRYTPQ